MVGHHKGRGCQGVCRVVVVVQRRQRWRLHRSIGTIFGRLGRAAHHDWPGGLRPGGHHPLLVVVVVLLI